MILNLIDRVVGLVVGRSTATKPDVGEIITEYWRPTGRILRAWAVPADEFGSIYMPRPHAEDLRQLASAETASGLRARATALGGEWS